MRHRLIQILLIALVAVAALSTNPALARAHGGLGLSLYDHLGGVYGIAPLVEDFVDRLWSNPVIVANPDVAEARQRYAKASLVFLLTEYLCDKAGGPMVYRGRDMKTSHAGLNISEKEWQAMAADLRKSMGKFSLPEETQADLMEILDLTKKDIVVGTAPTPAPGAEMEPGHAR